MVETRSTNKMQDVWNSWSRSRRLITFLVAFVLVAGMTVVATSTVSRASGTDQRMCQPGGHAEFRCRTNKQMARKFLNHKIHHAHGFSPAVAFKNPRKFRKLAHSKMVTYLRHHPKAEGQLRAKYLTKRDPGCTDNCLAWKAYGDLMSHSNCGAGAPLNIDPRTCRAFETGHEKAVVRGITIVYCGGALILGATGALATDGVGAPVAATIYGGIGCGWGFMASFF